MDKPLKINWYGSVGQGQGYSGSGENICVALDKQGVDVRMVGFSDVPPQNLTREGSRLKRKEFHLAEVGLTYGFPVAFSSMSWNKVKLGLTMFETDRLPSGKSWAGVTGNAADSCNSLNALFVPCEHNRQLFSDSGVTCPIEVVHLGIDTERYKYKSRLPDRPFTFLQLGNLSVRKNTGAVISAFLSLFANNKDVKLVIKTAAGSIHNNIDFPADNIEVINEYTTFDKLLDYYYNADCFVFPTRGEGFGLPPLEAMATGIPAIIADHTGMHEYADDKYCYVIRKSVKKPAQFFPKEWGDVGNWYEPDYQELKELMLHCYNNRDEVSEKGKLASEWVRSHWSIDRTAERLVQLIEKYYNRK